MNTLIVCTGNICRSPMGEVLLRERFAERGIPAKVLSAGLVTENQPASSNGVKVMAERGLDLRHHRSQKITPPLLAGADLIIGMERQHVREVAVVDKDRFPVSFTLPELSRRVHELGPRGADESVDDYLRRASAGRKPSDLLRHDADDEISDPIGESIRRYEQTAQLIEGHLDVVVAHLYP